MNSEIFITTLCVMLIIFMIIVLHRNLPPKDIKNNLSIRDIDPEAYDEHPFLYTMLGRISASQSIAQWRFYDFIIFKLARSERFENLSSEEEGNSLILIGLPFCKWKLIKMGKKYFPSLKDGV